MSDQPFSSPALAPSARPFERLASLRLRLDWELALYALFIGVGAVLRFWDLGARAFHHDESLHAQYAWYLFRDGPPSWAPPSSACHSSYGATWAAPGR
jgi:hypothetical protein